MRKNKKEGTRVRKHERVHVRYVGGAPAEQHLLFELRERERKQFHYVGL